MKYGYSASAVCVFDFFVSEATLSVTMKREEKHVVKNKNFGAVLGRIFLFGFLMVLFAGSASAAPQVDIKELTAKAEAGDGEAQLKLGACYYQGRGIPKDYEKAVYWWKKSAEGGNPAAQYFLGACYARGNGIGKDEKKAVELYQRAAEAGFALAQFDLAMAYKSGLGGIPKCPENAFYWTERSASQGYARAELYLGVCYTEGRGTPVDYAAAMKWYRKAADQGDTDAQVCIGYQYLRGNGVDKDAEKAEEYFLSAAQNGNSAGINELAKCYYKGASLKHNTFWECVIF